MKKQIEEEIFHKQFDAPITWNDIKYFEFQDNDILDIGYKEGFYSENNSWDGGHIAVITRTRLETDNEYNKRLLQEEQNKKHYKEQRYKNYLKLKQEFEHE